MKVIASLVILASTCTAFSANKKAAKIPTKKPGSKNGALSRRDLLIGAGAATIATTFWDVEFLEVARNKGKSPLSPAINGIYADPNHESGYRVVRAIDKTNAVVTLQDDPSGPIFTFDGKIKNSKKDGTTLTLDLSPKGGPKDVVATFFDGDQKQLYFPDGNAWTKSTGVDGIYTDPNHPAGYRVVRIAKDKMYITLQDEPNGDIIEVEGKKRGSEYLLDFSSKGGPKDIPAAIEEGKIVFPDGNSWTKL